MRRHQLGAASTGAVIAAALALAAAALARPAAAQPGPESLAGLRLHAERDNTTDARVPGPVNFIVESTIDSIDRDTIAYTVDSRIIRVGGGVALHMVTRVKVAFAQVTVIHGENPTWLIGFQCPNDTRCIAWTVSTYGNDDASARAPTGGLENQSTLATSDPAAFQRIHAVLCTLAKCED